MAEPRLISPLLDGFVIGEPISDHQGVQSCPALRTDTDERYIVKIVSIPPSQNQLEALLLSGAFSDEQAALSYFKELSEDVCKEAAILSRLSKLEGFLPYQSSQTIKMSEDCGYQVYLLSPYRRSLDRQMKTDPLSHLAAVNLGLDMCAALAVCRKAGYLYANLKPENIYISDMRGYCIGDLGFIPLTSMKYASLPEKYRSSYTPPEITDAYASLSDTLDIYALGLVLYQVFNNGILPEPNESPMPVPTYADYEMAAIIMKACSPNPSDRWTSPDEMGQALVDYMQRNAVDDVPIIPAPAIEEIPLEDEPEDFLSEEENDRELAELLAMIPDEEPPVTEDASGEETNTDNEESNLEMDDPEDEAAAEELPPPDEESISDSIVSEPCEDSPQGEDNPENTQDEVSNDVISSADETIGQPGEVQDDTSESAISQEEISDSTVTQQQITDLPAAEEATVPTQEEPAYPRTELTEEGVTTEVAEMLAQADELLQMKLPEPVVAPDPIDIPIPPPIVLTPEPDPTSEVSPSEDIPSEAAESMDNQTEIPSGETDEPTPPPTEQPQTESGEIPAEAAAPQRQRKLVRSIIVTAIVLALLAAAFLFAGHYYRNVYWQTVESLEITGHGNEIIVHVGTNTDENLLTVVCTDTYGNTFRSPLTNGSSKFEELNYGTRYSVSVEISGFHKLKGNISGNYTTANQTQILNFQATPGAEDGSAIISFTVSGPNSNKWTLQYYAPNIAPAQIHITGTSATVNQLTIGAEYTFELLSSDDLIIVEGSNITTYTPQKIPYAEDIVIQSYIGGRLELSWSVPEGTSAEKWNIRCSNGQGVDLEFTADTQDNPNNPGCIIEQLDPSFDYTIYITAEGTSKTAETTLTANPINITQYTTQQEGWNLSISWNYDGKAPANGWILFCEIADLQTGSSITMECTKTEEQTDAEGNTIVTAAIPVLPNQEITFHARPKDDITCFSPDPMSITTSMIPYIGQDIQADEVSVTIHQTPEEPDRTLDDLLQQTTINVLNSQTSATVLLQHSDPDSEFTENTTLTFVIIDGNNSLVSAQCPQEPLDALWKDGYAIIPLPSVPNAPGNYTLCVYLASGTDAASVQQLLGCIPFEVQ